MCNGGDTEKIILLWNTKRNKRIKNFPISVEHCKCMDICNKHHRDGYSTFIYIPHTWHYPWNIFHAYRNSDGLFNLEAGSKQMGNSYNVSDNRCDDWLHEAIWCWLAANITKMGTTWKTAQPAPLDRTWKGRIRKKYQQSIISSKP